MLSTNLDSNLSELQMRTQLRDAKTTLKALLPKAAANAPQPIPSSSAAPAASHFFHPYNMPAGIPPPPPPRPVQPPAPPPRVIPHPPGLGPRPPTALYSPAQSTITPYVPDPSRQTGARPYVQDPSRHPLPGGSRPAGVPSAQLPHRQPYMAGLEPYRPVQGGRGAFTSNAGRGFTSHAPNPGKVDICCAIL